MKRVLLGALLSLGILASAFPASALPIRVFGNSTYSVEIDQYGDIDNFSRNGTILTEDCIVKVNVGSAPVGLWVKAAPLRSNRQCFRSIEKAMIAEHGFEYQGLARVMSDVHRTSRYYLNEHYYSGTVVVAQQLIGDATITGIIDDGELWIGIQ